MSKSNYTDNELKHLRCWVCPFWYKIPPSYLDCCIALGPPHPCEPITEEEMIEFFKQAGVLKEEGAEEED